MGVRADSNVQRSTRRRQAARRTLADSLLHGGCQGLFKLLLLLRRGRSVHREQAFEDGLFCFKFCSSELVFARVLAWCRDERCEDESPRGIHDAAKIAPTYQVYEHTPTK